MILAVNAILKNAIHEKIDATRPPTPVQMAARPVNSEQVAKNRVMM